MDPVEQRFVIIPFSSIGETLNLTRRNRTGISSMTLQMINKIIESRGNSTLNPEITYIDPTTFCSHAIKIW